MKNKLKDLTAKDLRDVLEKFSKGTPKTKPAIWEMTNEIKPDTLYCYLYARFGHPNGVMNLLRNDHSDNLIHWEWTVSNDDLSLSFQGHNFRTEILVSQEGELTLSDLVDYIKNDLKNYGKDMKLIREKLEKWNRFMNPFYRIESAVKTHFSKLRNLNIDIEKERVPSTTPEEFSSLEENWNEISEKYHYAIGLTFGLRTMLPILAESFVNLLIFILAKPEIKKNERLFQSTIRQQIDIRIQSLHLNCYGFKNPVDYTDQICKDFHTLMNERNDLLHGNVEPKKLSIGEVYFNGNVPIYKKYEDFWDQAMGVSLRSVKFETINKDHETVQNFISYILNQLDEKCKEEIEFIISKRELGINLKTGGLASLFPDHIVDMRLQPF